MSFKISQAKALRNRQDPAGDLIRDMLADKDFPWGEGNRMQREYLQNNGACDAALKAFDGLVEWLYKHATP